MADEKGSPAQSLASVPNTPSPPSVVVQALPVVPVESIEPVVSDAFGARGRGSSPVDREARGSPSVQMEKAKRFPKFADLPEFVRYLLVTAAICVPLGMLAMISKFLKSRCTVSSHCVEISTVSRVLLYVFFTHMVALITMSAMPIAMSAIEAILCRRVFGSMPRAALRHALLIRHHWASVFSTAVLNNVLSDLSTPSMRPLYPRIANVLSPTVVYGIGLTAFAAAILLLVANLITQRVAVSMHNEYFSSRIDENAFVLLSLERIANYINSTFSDSDVHQAPHSIVSSAFSIFSRTKDNTARRQPMTIFTEPQHEAAIAESTPDAAAEAIVATLGNGTNAIREESMFCVLSPEDSRRIFLYFIEAASDVKTDGMDASREQIAAAIAKAVTERESLATTAEAQADMIHRLQALLGGIAIVIVALLCFPIFQVSAPASLTFFTTFAMSAKFIFNQTIDQLYEIVLFLFVVHPYDVGDKVYFGDASSSLRVRSLGWMHSSYIGGNGRVVYKHNPSISKQAIANIRRSPPQNETYTFRVAIETTGKQIAVLEAALNDFVQTHKRDYTGSVTVNVTGIVNAECMVITFDIGHRSNFQDGGVANKRTLMVQEFAHSQLETLGIRIARYNLQL